MAAARPPVTLLAFVTAAAGPRCAPRLERRHRAHPLFFLLRAPPQRRIQHRAAEIEAFPRLLVATDHALQFSEQFVLPGLCARRARFRGLGALLQRCGVGAPSLFALFAGGLRRPVPVPPRARATSVRPRLAFRSHLRVRLLSGRRGRAATRLPAPAS